MNPSEVCRAIYDAGLTVRVDDGNLALKPAERLTPELRAILVAHKPELIQFLIEAEHTAAELVKVSMRACVHYQDCPEAVEQMRLDCMAIPPHQRACLLDHFTTKYPIATKAKDTP